ncbi:unnamed protein product [Adineta steineri]|uniref:G-protein coupled receptors family 1 profile domain-containing protein n=1 Tax=Adineta steineri TaxID=433720 RepID=A0A820HN50_9BILA|nr:unnamed protein product [Adineta steineri]CAF4293663.1 unnamed protein product [Adineta steineri]
MSSSSVFTKILNFVISYSGYSGYIIFILGVIGNAINILVFTQLKVFRNNRCVYYLTVESISSFLYQFISIGITISSFIYEDDATGHSLIWCRFRYMSAQALVLTTLYTICFAAMDQFFSTNYRFYVSQMCTLKVAQYVIYISVSIWIIHSIIFGLFFNIEPSIGCVISNPIFLQYATFFFYPVLGGFLPIVIAAIFSLLAYRNVRRIVRRQLPVIRRRLDRQMTAMVLMRALFFICLQCPNNIYRIYITNFPNIKSENIGYVIVRLIQAIVFSLAILNYSISFYVFIISSSRFRRQVKYVLVKKCWKRCMQWHYLTNNQVAPQNVESFSANMEVEENI